MKSMITSVISFLSALMLFFVVVYAWFTITNESTINPTSLTVTEGISFNYEIKYFTKDYIYRYDLLSQSIQVYDESTSTWVSPINSPGGPVYLLDGVFISQYDVLIPENNSNNNLIIELSLTFTNDEPLLLTQRMERDFSLSSQVASSMTLDTSRAYGVSEVANIQMLTSSAYNGYADAFNKYTMLNAEFNLRDGSNNLIYPMQSFYQSNVLQPNLNLGNTVIEVGSTLRFYYNISYDELKVNQFFNQEFQTAIYDITSIPTILFFQDIKIIMIGGAVS